MLWCVSSSKVMFLTLWTLNGYYPLFVKPSSMPDQCRWMIIHPHMRNTWTLSFSYIINLSSISSWWLLHGSEIIVRLCICIICSYRHDMIWFHSLRLHGSKWLTTMSYIARPFPIMLFTCLFYFILFFYKEDYTRPLHHLDALSTIRRSWIIKLQYTTTNNISKNVMTGKSRNICSHR